MIKPKNNKELKEMIVDGVINCNYSDLICDFNINVEGSIINARNINAWDINALDINANDINARNINANDINAGDINANDINAGDINANDINALDINAWDINYYAVCLVYKNINCTSIKGRRENSKHFCLEGEIKIIKELENE